MSHGEITHQHQIALRNVQKYDFEPEPSKDLSCKTSGLSTTDAALATGATIGAGYVIYRGFDLYLHLHHLFGGQYLQTLLLHD